MWDSRFSKRIYAYGKLPNAFFAQELSKIRTAGILLPAEGEGRNAVHALKNGWNVIAFDQSEKGREKALSLAAENGVVLDYTIAEVVLSSSTQAEHDPATLVLTQSRLRVEISAS